MPRLARDRKGSPQLDFSLTDEQLELQSVARRFAYTELWPAAQALDKAARPADAFPAELLARASALGLRTLKLPPEYGGRGINAVTEALVLEDPERARPLEDMAMLYTSEMGIRTAAQCLRIFGARGSLRDWPMEKLVRDASTIMLPPIGNEASWARVGSFVARHPSRPRCTGRAIPACGCRSCPRTTRRRRPPY